jgi:hypothetical protein
MFENMAIENPFIFGKAAEGTSFTDRSAQRTRGSLCHRRHFIIYPLSKVAFKNTSETNK